VTRSERTLRRGLGFFALAWLIGAAPSAAQDFLFRDPRATLGLRFGYALPTASSEIFDFTREQLTVNRSDFNAAVWGGELAIRVAPRIDVALSFSSTSSSTPSEFRDWVDDRDLPIEQETRLVRRPLTLAVKAFLRDRGRSVGRFAWIPERWAPYVGAGVGYTWYTFEQTGDFIDFETLDIFKDHFEATGRTPTVHLLAGAEWSLGPSLLLTGEGRYAWARADMGGDFVDFDRMDLSGFEATAGIAIRF